jgi:hypothetical protein
MIPRIVFESEQSVMSAHAMNRAAHAPNEKFSFWLNKSCLHNALIRHPHHAARLNALFLATGHSKILRGVVNGL